MFCNACGNQATGNYCGNCGNAMVVEIVDLDTDVRYERLIQQPEVRARISSHAALAPKSIDPVKFLKGCDKLLGLMGEVGVCSLAAKAVPFWSRLGFNTENARKELLPFPAGRMIVNALCSLAERGLELKEVHQGEDGCVLEATIPGNFWTWNGDLNLSIRQHARGTEIEAAAKIHGQLIDWGRSRRLLDDLFADLNQLSQAS